MCVSRRICDCQGIYKHASVTGISRSFGFVLREGCMSVYNRVVL